MSEPTLHLHKLTGCQPTPLAHYLKALGVLRLVSAQADAEARGWWRNEHFHLATRLDREALMQFFLHHYQPTPLVAPWNGGSGFYPKDNRGGIDAIADSAADRLATYREAIMQARDLVADRDERPSGEAKTHLLQQCRRYWRGPLLDWLEAALVLDEQGEPSYPALLGTGGNDGRLDYTNNFMQWIARLFDCSDPAAVALPAAGPWLEAALFGGPHRDRQSGAIGQFLPGDAGGANSGVGFEGKVGFNPWDFVLMLEGTLVFAAAITRRAGTLARGLAASPFAMRSSAVGYGSAAGADEGGRGEQWMPLWSQPATAGELTQLIAEGRCQIHRTPAERPLDMARALARLGMARGITAFERYGYVERYGKNNLAVPLGRWNVEPVPEAQLLDDVADWVDTLRRAGRDKNAPAAIGRAARACEEAMLACCRPQAGRDKGRWERLLIALGQAEAQLVRSPRFTASSRARLEPLGWHRIRQRRHGLQPGWIHAACDGSTEWRLALALAGLHEVGSRSQPDSAAGAGQADENRKRRVRPIRCNFMPLDERGLMFAKHGEVLAHDPAVVACGQDLLRTAVPIMRRRIVEARRSQTRSAYFPLQPMPNTQARLGDIIELIEGRVDETRLLQLARPLMALDWAGLRKTDAATLRDWLGEPDRNAASSGATAIYGLFKLCHHHQAITPAWRDRRGKEQVGQQAEVRLDPSILTRLASNDLAGAANTACRRLRAAGLPPRLTTAVGEGSLAQRLATALIFPLSRRDIGWLAGRLIRPTVDDPQTSDRTSEATT